MVLHELDISNCFRTKVPFALDKGSLTFGSCRIPTKPLTERKRKWCVTLKSNVGRGKKG